MIICSCNGLSDKDVETAIQSGVVKLSGVYAAKKCRVQCGNCVPGVACLLKAALKNRCACSAAAQVDEEVNLQVVGASRA